MFRLVPSLMISTTQAPISNVEEEKAEKKSKKEQKEERRKAKAKEHVLGKAQNATQRAAVKAEGLSEGGIKPWECKSLMDSGASYRSPIFTPDCRKNVLDYDWSSCFNIVVFWLWDWFFVVGCWGGAYRQYYGGDHNSAECLPTLDCIRHRRIDNPCVFTSPRLATSSYRQIMISESELDTSENESSKVYRVSLNQEGHRKASYQIAEGDLEDTENHCYDSFSLRRVLWFIKFVSNEMLACLAFHPTEDCMATGGNIGQIRLWYCLDPALMESASEGLQRRAKTATMPWHAHPVSSLSFSGNGAYLLSGGEEAVFGYSAEFVRAPISTISVTSHQTSDEEYLLVLPDATIVSISSATVRIARNFARAKHDPKFWSSGPAPILFHTLASTKSLNPSRVEKAVISPEGLWLATIDSRGPDCDFEREAYFKTCQWDVPSSTWNLNNRIDRPRGIHKVLFAAAAAVLGVNRRGWQREGMASQDDFRQVERERDLLVAFGSTTVVYEMSTNVQRLTLKIPETRNISDQDQFGGRALYQAPYIKYWHWTAIYPRRYQSGLENRLNRRGDRVTIPEDEGAIIRSNSKDTRPQGHLFQYVSSLDSNKILNVPHYLLPQTLYGPLVEVLVRLRPKGSPSAEEEPEELEDEDAIMGDAETTTATKATRAFSEEEMTLSAYSVTKHLAVPVVKPTPSHKLTNENGGSKAAANSTHPHRNGSNHVSSMPKNGKAHPQVRSVSTTKAIVTQSVDSSPAVVAKKWKKSMG
ncbi:hypothetical protein M422DRAFT_272448 [Sphaerobolus stellatus SS14]|uniref:Uncharacterized protein n=1 Tax=Sphaerobolus stellatus (strain SS14) TaxID=990650 RepID=A0A0C9UMI7_SPHS4|nr:hypothetical protein M422DRAFT_272448 [Sphaerobolus stellatus SS14]